MRHTGSQKKGEKAARRVVERSSVRVCCCSTAPCAFSPSIIGPQNRRAEQRAVQRSTTARATNPLQRRLIAARSRPVNQVCER